MSVPEINPSSPPPPRPQRLSRWMVVLAILVGIVLVLPGLCSLALIIALFPQIGSPGGIGVLWLLTFVIAGAGVWLIVYAIRNR